MKRIILSVFFTLFILAGFSQAGTFQYYRVTNAGGTVNVAGNATPNTAYVYCSSGVTLANDYNLVITSVPALGTRWKAYIDLTLLNFNGHNVNVFGFDVTEEFAAKIGYLEWTVIKDHTGGTVGVYNVCPVFVDPNNPQQIYGESIIDGTLSIDALDGDIPLSSLDTIGQGRVVLGGASNVPSSLYLGTNGYIPIGNGTTITSNAVSGDITLSNAGVVAIASGVIVNADVNASAAIARTKLADGTADYVVINSGTGAMSQEARLAASRGGTAINTSASTGFPTVSSGTWSVGTVTESENILVSFESGYQSDNKIKMPCAGTITGLYGYVTKAIANTDAGTIIAKNAAGTTMGSSTLTFAASDAIGTAYSSTPATNNTFSAGDILYFTGAKTTAGGMVQLTITYTRSN